LSDDSNKGGEERHIVGVHTWCAEINKPRAYVLSNSLTASGSGKHHSDVEYQVVRDEYGITNVSGLVGNNASTQKGKANGLIANNSRVFERDMFFVGCYPHVLNIMLRRMCQVGLGAKGDMNNNHVLQPLYKISWLHYERPSQYKSMYASPWRECPGKNAKVRQPLYRVAKCYQVELLSNDSSGNHVFVRVLLNIQYYCKLEWFRRFLFPRFDLRIGSDSMDCKQL